SARWDGARPSALRESEPIRINALLLASPLTSPHLASHAPSQTRTLTPCFGRTTIRHDAVSELRRLPRPAPRVPRSSVARKGRCRSFQVVGADGHFYPRGIRGRPAGPPDGAGDRAPGRAD